MHADIGSEAACLAILEHYGMTDLVKSAYKNGWHQVVEKLEEILKNHSFKDAVEKNIFVDLFFSYCLAYLSLQQSSGDFWTMLEKWFHHRNPSQRSGSLSTNEQAAAILVTLKLRDILSNWLLETNCSNLQLLEEVHQNLMLTLWRQVFFDMSAPHNMLWDTQKWDNEKIGIANFVDKGFTGLLAASMYYPLEAEIFDVDCDALFDAPLPLHCRNILVCWLINIPYFNGHMKHRDRLDHYVPKLCATLLRRSDQIGIAYFISLVQEIMASFWRASYIGGNNVNALSSFGDMIHTIINHLCHNLPRPVSRQRKPDERIRIGYISRNIYRQAVPYYMMNRIIHHNRDKFEVFIFSLAERQDDFTEIFVNNSDHYERFADLKNFGAMINSVLTSQLDILIFTDIGMDAVTYILGGLRLAPVQCVMVGHGTTTGLPTIDYYLSGDFEAPNAQEQYREKLIRLPKLGAAQYLPDPPLRLMTRKDLGVPDDAVLFMSCANGIKHRAEREKLYIEILKRAPNAWILLKPYTTPGGIDAKLAKRLREAAMEAGVSDRLLILPSIGHYRAVLGLLELADVQLDTYPYGGWTTNMEALYVGLPIVTQEGELSRSRWGAGMLRALGIEEGIAANEEEFIEQAVRFAGDHELRLQIAQKIKTRAVDVLFNGPVAQPSFEKVLLDIVEGGQEQKTEYLPAKLQEVSASTKNVLKDFGHVAVILPKELYLATSIAPKNYDEQRAALETWRKAGFRIIAVNPADEIDDLWHKFPEIRFVPAARDARQEYQKPYIYFDDILASLARTKAHIGGIVNSDIYLIENKLYEYLANQSEKFVLFGSRFDAASPVSKEGKIYTLGFDFFFFHKDYLVEFPQEAFCLGLPWWDFWAGLIPLERKWAVRRLVTPVATHVAHQTAWNKDIWLHLGNRLSRHFPAPSPLSPETMLVYLNYCAQRINRDARDVML